jgi:hypothetical protein
VIAKRFKLVWKTRRALAHLGLTKAPSFELLELSDSSDEYITINENPMSISLSTSNASKMLLTLHATPDNYVKCEELLNIIMGVNFDWIGKNGLTNVTIRLLAIQKYKPSSLNGNMLAMFAGRLLAAEDEVGGPYTYKNEDKIRLNTLIAHLFFNFGKPLPRLNDYLINLDLHEHSEATPRKPKADLTTKLIKRELELLIPLQKDIALRIWESVIIFDQHKEITKLSKFFYASLKVKPDIPEDFFTNVGIANFYAWMAYSIYDDLIDGEETARLLPLANILQRKSIYRYLRTSNDDFIQDFYDKVDNANFYELNNLRFQIDSNKITIDKIPDYEDGEFLANRAIGHILGPCIIIEHYMEIDDLQKASLNRALECFLIARQLNDDSHDWIKDLKNGHASYVVSFLLRKAGVDPGTYSLAAIVSKLRRYFWQSGLKEISDLTINYVENSALLLKGSGLFYMSGSFFRQVLEPIRLAATKSIEILDNQKLFLKKYDEL